MFESRRILASAGLVVVLAAPGLASPGFLPNVGQLPEPASHILLDGETTVICEPGRLVITIGDETRTLRFEGAAVPSQIEARLPLPTRYTFLLGNDPARWRRDVHASAELVYHDLWPGLALIVSATTEALRWEVVAAPGANLAAGRVVWEGVSAAAGRVTWPRPSPRTAAVTNPSALAWATFFGGENTEKALVVRAAPDGTLVIAGRTDSLTFPTTPGGYDQIPAGDNDAYVAKMSANGEALLWCTLIGGTAYDVAGGVAIAADGSVVLTGNTSSVDFPTTPDAYQTVHRGLRDAWAARLSADGADLQWSTFLGGSSVDEGVALVLDADDGPILLGNTASPDYPTTSGAYDRMFNGDWDAFVLRLDPAGHALTWSTFLGGDRFDIAHGLTLDGGGKPVVVGQTASPGFPTTAGAFDETANGGDDAFVCALTPDGSDLAWSTLLGGAAADAANGVTMGEPGRVLVAGSTESPDFPTTAGAFNTVHRGATDMFVACLAIDGTSVLWGDSAAAPTRTRRGRWPSTPGAAWSSSATRDQRIFRPPPAPSMTLSTGSATSSSCA